MKPLRSSRALVALLLAVLLAGRLVVPTGWMPVRTAEGFGIMLCSGSGAGEAWIDSAGKLHKGQKPQGKTEHRAEHKDPCPYGAVSAPAALPAAPAMPALLPAQDPNPAPALLAVAIGRGLAAPPPPARGPPRSA